jgi:predicted nucleic acid-binding protein
MIFLDTSAIYAWTDAADPNHHASVRRLQAILERREELLTHNYVVVESLALLQARLGIGVAVKLARDSASFVIDWVDNDLHESGIRALEQSRKRRVTLVDHISFLVMKRRRLSVAFAFDPDFVSAGFRLFEA